MLYCGQSAIADDHCPIAGTWKSNEEKTFANMRKANLNEKQWEILGNGFFGRLILHVDCKGYTSDYDGEISKVVFDSIQIGGNQVTTEYYDEYLESTISSTVIIDGDCYSVELEGLDFAEVFCKIEERPQRQLN